MRSILKARQRGPFLRLLDRNDIGLRKAGIRAGLPIDLDPILAERIPRFVEYKNRIGLHTGALYGLCGLVV